MRKIGENQYVPDDGYKYISNGEVWTDSIFLGANDVILNWHDTNDEPPTPEEEILDNEAFQIILGGTP